MSFTHRITEADIHRIDVSDMAGHIARMGEHIRDAIKIFSAAALPPMESKGPIIVLGMGGSAIGADLVRSYLSGSFIVNRSYDLPKFANTQSLIIATSYSGNTEETLSAFEQAVERKLPIICITTGGTLGRRANELNLPVISQPPGMQPRAALAYSFVPILLLIEKLGRAGSSIVGDTSDLRANLERAAAMLDTLAERYGYGHLDDNNAAFKLAGEIAHRIPAIYAASDFEAVALRWRGQIQENAKHVAFSNLLPEMNHNELEGWGHPIDLIQHFSVIFLRSQPDEHPRVTKRFTAMREVFRSKQVDVIELAAEGETRLERMMSLIALADWTSLYLALFAGIDPTAITAIEMLKQKMGE
ncbi:MAG TPA: bifunctional phosphoglucose/phosphomannose isomerase [Candidatus Kapabacteria bacterium]|nr:bifunctional phosphoglucose/phosphomannose isomerase [Candidatus Kapabacteria bacterium]